MMKFAGQLHILLTVGDLRQAGARARRACPESLVPHEEKPFSHEIGCRRADIVFRHRAID